MSGKPRAAAANSRALRARRPQAQGTNGVHGFETSERARRLARSRVTTVTVKVWDTSVVRVPAGIIQTGPATLPRPAAKQGAPLARSQLHW